MARADCRERDRLRGWRKGECEAFVDAQDNVIAAGYRTLSPVFGYTLPDKDNLYQFFGLAVSGPQSPAVADGFYLLLSPLTPGKHVLTFGGTTLTHDPDGNPAVFSLDIRYHITVVPGKH